MKCEPIITEVAVVGGGSAGLAASVTAARTGASTLLIERHGYLGGMGTSALVHSFCGMYLLPTGDAAPRFANQGFPVEIAERMQHLHPSAGPVRMGRVWVFLQHPWDFVRLADDLCSAEKNLRVSAHSNLISIRRNEEANLWELEMLCNGSNSSVKTRAIVDASGDAAVALMLNKAQPIGATPRQRPAYICGISGVEALTDEIRMQTSAMIVDGVRKGRLSAAALGITFRNSGREREVFSTLDLSGGSERGNYDPCNGESLNAIGVQGRSTTIEVVKWLSQTVPVWRQATITFWPAMLGIRESHAWLGKSVITGDDLLAGKRGPSDVALASWPLEMRETPTGPRLHFPSDGRTPGIPLASLETDLAGLYSAGRCLSADHRAQASLRVMATCFATGQAAGMAAAHFAMGITGSDSLARIQRLAGID